RDRIRAFHVTGVQTCALPIVRKAYAFPVRRGRSDRQAIRHALNVLKEGHVVALFPEGTRSKTGELLELQRGAALLALHSGAPIRSEERRVGKEWTSCWHPYR